jgi:uncharacterized protein DUF5916
LLGRSSSRSFPKAAPLNRVAAFGIFLLSLCGSVVSAQEMAGETLSRDASGATRVRATRISTPLILDGQLTEEIYQLTPSIGGFLQQEPHEGEPVTEKTEAWLFFDDRNLYVAARCEDSHPERQVANEMRRDGQATNDNESFAVVLDTFHDLRNAFLFQVSLAGGMFDAYITDERDMNRDWNTVWDARTARFEGGWTTEFVIPFKSLRFRTGQEQIWGINFKRVVRWKNEQQFLTRIPAAMGRRGIVKLSSAATLVGLEPPVTHRNFEVKPYGIGGVTTARPAEEATTSAERDAGFDVKVGLTEGVTSDFTYNTDFAQVEEDEQQVNLTRFSVLFPEKRDFFLEGQGIFSFGGLQNQPRSGGGGGGGGSGNPNANDIPVLFFSRRIGLNNGVEIPIDVGGRVTGKVGHYSIGVLDIRTANTPSAEAKATNFGVVRVKRDVLRRSAVGVLFGDRSVASLGGGPSRTYGVDGLFSFYQNLNVNTFFARTETPGGSGQDTSYRMQLDYAADRYGVQLERLALDERFNPDIGFLRRPAFTRNSAYLRFSPRPERFKAIRKFTWSGQVDYITDPGGRLQSRLGQASFQTELQGGDAFSAEAAWLHESLDEPFEISKGVLIPVGGYSYPEIHLQYNFGAQRKASGNVLVERGSFYNGTRTSISTSRGRAQITPQLSVEPGLSIDWVNLAAGRFVNRLLTARTSYALSPRMSTSALIQYNSSTSTFNTNLRFRWEYQPGSDFFVVYTDNRDTTLLGFPTLRSRGLVVKLTRLLRM